MTWACENHRMSEASPGPQGDPSEPSDPAQRLREEELVRLTEDLGSAPPERPGGGRLVAALASGLLVIALLAWGLPWATGASWAEILRRGGALPWWSLPAMLVIAGLFG